METVKNVLRGAVMGVAEIIPGVSGGTMAVLMGIYDELIGSVSHITKNLKKSVRFLLPLLIGMGGAIVGFSYLITYLLDNFPMAVNAFFMGLVIGIVPLMYKKATEQKHNCLSVIPGIIMIAVMIVLAFISSKNGTGMEQVIQMDFLQVIRFIAVGFLAAVCLMLPGISGSMIMVIFGTYYSVVSAIKQLDILYLIPAGIGIILGLLYGSKLIYYCLNKYTSATYFTIIGLVVGSLFSLYQKAAFDILNSQFIVAVITFIAGIVISLLFTSNKFNSNKTKNKGVSK